MAWTSRRIHVPGGVLAFHDNTNSFHRIGVLMTGDVRTIPLPLIARVKPEKLVMPMKRVCSDGVAARMFRIDANKTNAKANRRTSCISQITYFAFTYEIK